MLQAAEQTAAAAAKQGTGRVHEAAMFAALAGHLPLMQAACTGWQDACWAASRAWLEHAVDAGAGHVHLHPGVGCACFGHAAAACTAFGDEATMLSMVQACIEAMSLPSQALSTDVVVELTTPA